MLLEKSKRIPAIDRLRGIAIALMLGFGSSVMFTAADFFTQLSTHDLTKALLLLPGYGFYDTIAPMFIFASGLSFAASFSSSSRTLGLPDATRASARKAVKVVGLGSLLLFAPSDPIGIVFFALMFVVLAFIVVYFVFRYKKKDVSAFSFYFDKLLVVLGVLLLVVALVDNILYVVSVDVPASHWNVLPTIGLCMLCALPFMQLSATGKVASAYLLTALYLTCVLLLPETHFIYFTHGGMLGSFGYALLFFYAVVCFELQKSNRFLSHAFAATLAVLAVASFAVIHPSKASVNVTYALISFAFCYVLYSFLQLFDRFRVKTFPILTIIGQNALFVYSLHFFLTFAYGIALNALVAFVPIEVPAIKIAMLFVGMGIYVCLMALLMRSCNKKGIRFKV